MFKNVVVGVDGHQGGRDAVALAAAEDPELRGRRILGCAIGLSAIPLRASEAGQLEKTPGRRGPEAIKLLHSVPRVRNRGVKTGCPDGIVDRGSV